MRHLLIDTDTGSDDAVALIAALREPSVQVEVITTVCGNVPLPLATNNALISIAMANTYQPPVYMGADKPLCRPLYTAENVHGEDGLGDMYYTVPSIPISEGFAPDAILDYVRKFPHGLEIVTLGPATNIALAIQKDAETMAKVKHIYTMGTGGFGPGNVTPVAEFNVYVDAEAYKIMLESGIPVTIAGFDLCLGGAAFTRADMDALHASGDPAASFAVDCNSTLIEYNLKRSGQEIIDFADPVAMAVALWADVVAKQLPCHCYVCTIEEPAYGQVILDYGQNPPSNNTLLTSTPNAVVVKSIDNVLFKTKLMQSLTKQATPVKQVSSALKIISVKESPQYKNAAVAYFQKCWATNDSLAFYEDSILSFLVSPSPLPQWYLLTLDDEIIGCAGLITNDLISRMDLYPWLCALYIEKPHRKNAYGKLLIDYAKQDAKALGFASLYLCTDNIGYYEQYGFTYIATGYHPWGETSRIYQSIL